MTIGLKDLKAACVKAIEEYGKSYGVDAIEVDEDYYWTVTHENMFNFQEESQKFQLGVGSFDDEIPQITKYLEDEDIGYDANQLQYIASVFQYISDQNLREKG